MSTPADVLTPPVVAQSTHTVRLSSSPLQVFLALIWDTIQEARARWLFWGLFGLSTLLILFFLFVLKIDVVAGAVSFMGLPTEAGRRIFSIEKFVRNAYMFVAVFLYVWGTFLAIFASAGLLPSVLEPGRIGLLLSKPIGRPMFLIGRYTGTLLVVAINNIYLITAIYLIIGWKTHIWYHSFLYAIPLATFNFAVMLTVVVLIGVLSESAALSLMVAVALMFISAVLAQRQIVVQLLNSEWSRQLWQAFYWIVPKTWDLGKIMHDLILREPATWSAQVWTSTAFALAVFLGAVALFQKKDY
jgi:ABC-type transport system involved in multi-copper enzyme maturation permease subunit